MVGRRVWVGGEMVLVGGGEGAGEGEVYVYLFGDLEDEPAGVF